MIRKEMTRIEELTNALEKGRAIFDEIMGVSDCSDFRAEELYFPAAVKASEAGTAFGSIASADNLEYMEYLLKEKQMSGKLQLVYLDPPFFSEGNYQATLQLFSEKKGKSPLIKAGAYEDSWADSMESYLAMLTARLFMVKELLADTGCIWLHLDWHSAHYVKLVLDHVFGYDNFVNEVIWTYKSGGASGKRFARKHDTLLMYSKSRNYKFRGLKEKSYNRDMKPYRFKGVEEFQDEKGWYTMVNMKDVWSIDMVGRTSSERTGYATQKPEKLLERIILSCTDAGDLCADFFAGSGTLAAAAEKLGRNWIICDNGKMALAAQIERMFQLTTDDGSCRPFQIFRKSGGESDYADIGMEADLEKAELAIRNYSPDLSGLSKKDQAIAGEYIEDDPASCIRFWTIDESGGHDVHSVKELIKGERAAFAGGTARVAGYDVFGNRFCWERIV